MSMSAEPAQEQAAYEAGDLDMVLTPSEDVQRVKADPVLGPEVVELPQLSITYYGYNNGIDPKTLKPFAACADVKACPTMNKDFRIALTQAIDKKAFIDATFAAVGAAGQQLRDAGHPRLPAGPRSVSVRSHCSQGKHGQGARRDRCRQRC